MKSSWSWIALVLEASLALATQNDIVELERRQRSRDCFFNNPSVLPGTPDPDFDFFAFCSKLLVPAPVTVTRTVASTTSVLTTVAVTTVITNVVTSGRTQFVTTTATATSVKTSIVSVGGGGTPTATTVAYCPSPTANPICGVRGWGYAENNIFSGLGDGQACHQQCLQNENCKSFQVQDAVDGGQPSCNLYKMVLGGEAIINGTSSPYVFFDRACPDYLPFGCNARSAARSLRERAAAMPVVKRQGQVDIPWFLDGYPIETLQEICGCLIPNRAPNPGAGSTVTKTVSVRETYTAVVTRTVTSITTRVTSATVSSISTVLATQLRTTVLTVTAGSGGVHTIYTTVL